jgi:hypothetical protein
VKNHKHLVWNLYTLPPHSQFSLVCLDETVSSGKNLSAYFSYILQRKKQFHNTPMEAQGGERMYSSYSFTTSALLGGEWSASRPGGALSPEKGAPVPIGKETGWAPEQVWTQSLEEKSSRLCRGSNLDCPIVQSVARHYTD